MVGSLSGHLSKTWCAPPLYRPPHSRQSVLGVWMGFQRASSRAHVRRRRFQAAFLYVVGANESLQSQSQTQRAEVANKRYPELLKDITAMEGGVVRWDGKGAWSVEKSCTSRPLKSNILKRGTDAVLRRNGCAATLVERRGEEGGVGLVDRLGTRRESSREEGPKEGGRRRRQ